MKFSYLIRARKKPDEREEKFPESAHDDNLWSVSRQRYRLKYARTLYSEPVYVHYFRHSFTHVHIFSHAAAAFRREAAGDDKTSAVIAPSPEMFSLSGAHKIARYKSLRVRAVSAADSSNQRDYGASRRE